MKAYFERFFSSFVTSLVLLLIYAVILAVATFVEKYKGTAVVQAVFYYSPCFFLLQFLLVINFVMAVRKHHVLKRGRWGLVMTHVAFVVILLGAFVSFLTGVEGVLHLREGERSNQVVVQASDGVSTFHTLPFSVELKKFTLKRYPGSDSPSSYESDVVVYIGGQLRPERIYMNNVLEVEGYRFFQASYDPDEFGTVLYVNRDVAGRTITYIGYFLLALGLVFSLLGKNSRFMRLNRRLKELRGSSVGLLVLVFLLGVSVETRAKESDAWTADIGRYVVNPAHAARFGSLPMLSAKGRVMPVNTFSSEILRKLHKSDKIGNLNSDQFLISLLALPKLWMHVPFIVFGNPELAACYGLPEGGCAYSQVFDQDGNYKLQEKLEEAYHKMPALRTRFDKDLMKLDEQINIFHQLVNHQMLNLFPLPGDPDYKWYAPGDDLSKFADKDSLFVSRIFDWYVEEVQIALQEGNWSKADEVADMMATYQKARNKTFDIDLKKIEVELKYNNMNVFRYCKMGYLILGGLLLLCSFILILRQRKWVNVLGGCLSVGVILVFCFHIYGMGMRWYIAGYAPWSNSYETMVYVAWATVFAGLLFVCRSRITFALATLFGGVILFVSGLNWMDPEINPLVPVLKSPWLMFHVAVIVAAYGFFGIGCLMGITNMVMMVIAGKGNEKIFEVRIRELSIVNEMALGAGLVLMTAGTFIGAVWANESWGRYWGWDPKETWALITMVVYAMVTHLHLVRRWNSLWLFNFLSVLAFASVLMTFFGVNYFLSGMHSYGQNEQVQGLFLYFYLAYGVVILLAVLCRKRWKKII